jgi:hypothetical protein
MVCKMAPPEVFYRFVADRLWVGNMELSKELDIAIFPLKAESARIVRKKIGATFLAEMILVGFYMLGKDDGLGRGKRFSVFFFEEPLWSESQIDIPLDLGMKGDNHNIPC